MLSITDCKRNANQNQSEIPSYPFWGWPLSKEKITNGEDRLEPLCTLGRTENGAVIMGHSIAVPQNIKSRITI